MNKELEGEIKELIGFHCIQLIGCVNRKEYIKAEEHKELIESNIGKLKSLHEEKTDNVRIKLKGLS